MALIIEGEDGNKLMAKGLLAGGGKRRTGLTWHGTARRGRQLLPNLNTKEEQR